MIRAEIYETEGRKTIEKTVSSTNNSGIIGYSYIKEWKSISYHSQKVIQSGFKT